MFWRVGTPPYPLPIQTIGPTSRYIALLNHKHGVVLSPEDPRKSVTWLRFPFGRFRFILWGATNRIIMNVTS